MQTGIVKISDSSDRMTDLLILLARAQVAHDTARQLDQPSYYDQYLRGLDLDDLFFVRKFVEAKLLANAETGQRMREDLTAALGANQRGSAENPHAG